MADDINRLRALAGIPHGEVMDAGAVDDMDTAELDARDAREQKVAKAILAVCTRLGIDVATDENFKPNGVYYDERDERRGSITVDDYEITVAKLVALTQSGLGSDFTVKAVGDGLEIEFTVAEGLENAEIR